MSADPRRVVLKARHRPRFLLWGAVVLFGLLIFGLLFVSSPVVAAPPVVTLLSPTGGEDWTGGTPHAILWSVYVFLSPTVSYWINVSSDNGSTWSPFVNGTVSANNSTQTTAWTVPLVNTTVMRVQVCASLNGTKCVASPLPFQVDSAPPIGTPTPANGQTGVGVGSVVRLNFNEPMWTTPPPLTSLVFSPTVTISSVNWTSPVQLSVAHSNFAYATTYTWHVDCSIHDVSSPGNPLSGCGSPMWSFTTAANVPPNVTLSSPAGGEDWTGGTTHSIRWSVSDPDSPVVSYVIRVSSDNGASWSTLANGNVAADGSNRSFSWLTPLLTTVSMGIRVCASDNTTLVCASSPSFQVDSTRPVVLPWPASGAAQVARSAFMSLSFTEPMQTASLPLSAVTFVPAVSVLSLTWSSPVELLVTHADLAPSTNYTWYVDCSFWDASSPGNTIAGCGSPMWSFRTNTPPSAVSLAVDGHLSPAEAQRIPNDRAPTFTWAFQDPDANASQRAYEWRIIDPGSGSIVGDSGAQYSSASVSTYSGPGLVPSSCYGLNVRVFDGVDWGAWASLDFCIAPPPPFTLISSSILWAVVPISVTIVLASALAVWIWPRSYRLAEVTGVAEAVVAILIDLSLMITSLQPLRFDPSPVLVAAAVLIVFPVVVHFLPESPGAALDPSPRTKLLSDAGSGVLVVVAAAVFPPALAVAIPSVAADIGLAVSQRRRVAAPEELLLGAERPADLPPVGDEHVTAAPGEKEAGPPPPPPPPPPRPVRGAPPVPEFPRSPRGGEAGPPPEREEKVHREPPTELPFPTAAEPPPEERSGSARYVNVWFTSKGDEDPLSRDLSLKAGKRYHLRIDVGGLSAFSVVVGPQPPVPPLPPRAVGHWLEVVLLSNDFFVEPRLHYLFLPTQGPSWVCGCTPGGDHTCSEDTRQNQLAIEVVAPEKLGIAHLRIGLYYGNNLVQSQILTAEISDVEQEGAGHHSVVDYTLTAQLQDVGFLPPRALNILTNQNSDGTHTVVFKDGMDNALVFTIPESQLRSAIDTARATLTDIHMKVFGGQLGTKPQRENLYDENNSKDKAAFVEDLKRLSKVGWGLWCSLFQPAGPERQHRLQDFVRASGKTIQVARVQTTSFVFPWALVYDIPLEGDADAYTLCNVLKDWDPRSGSGAEELPMACPYADEHGPNTICPYGFWGMRHVIEEPPSSYDRNLPISIGVASPPQVVMSSSLDLDPGLASSHLQALSRIVPGFRMVRADSRDAVRDTLAAATLGLVYFYCHGKREEQPGQAAPVPYLEIGNEEKVRPTDITAWQVSRWTAPNHWATTPLIFINGCHTTELSPELLVNFVDAFSGANAGGVIGTEISIDQRIANEAAERFFRHFANQEPVGRALLLVRLGFLRKGNLLGLAYTAYCSSELRFTYT